MHRGQALTSSKALRLRPALARLGELCSMGGDRGVVPFEVALTSAGKLCMSLFSCSSKMATCHVQHAAASGLPQTDKGTPSGPQNGRGHSVCGMNGSMCAEAVTKAIMQCNACNAQECRQWHKV